MSQTRKRPLVLKEANGFPSSSRALVKAPPKPKNTRDPSGFYEMLGVPPWATQQEIKRAYWQLAKAFHPDGEEPDEEAFRLLTDIYETLSDPDKREMYNSTPEGSVYITESMKSSLFSSEGVVETFNAPAPKKWTPPEFKHWDYYTDTDVTLSLVSDWYSLLIGLAQKQGLEWTIRLGFQESLDTHQVVWKSDVPVLMLSPRLEPDDVLYGVWLLADYGAALFTLQESLYTG